MGSDETAPPISVLASLHYLLFQVILALQEVDFF